MLKKQKDDTNHLFNGKAPRIALILVTTILALSWNVQASAPEQHIAGIWWTPERDAKLEIYRTVNNSFSGRLIALTPEQAEFHDQNNPVPAKQKRPLLGAVILQGFVADPKVEEQWIDGEIYDPKSGSTYQGTLKSADADTLKVRGHLGVEIFGRTETFIRVKGQQPHSQQAGEPTLTHITQD